MREYRKPVVTVDAGLAEGIYVASGAGNSVSSGPLEVCGKWSGGGQAKFTLDLTNVNHSKLKVTVTFNKNISSGWGGGASSSIEGNKLILSWYEAPNTAEIYVQENSDIAQLQITGCSASNA